MHGELYRLAAFAVAFWIVPVLSFYPSTDLSYDPENREVGPEESRFTCYGSPTLLSNLIGYSPTYPVVIIGPDTTLSSLCLYVGTKCGYDFRDPDLFFDQLTTLQGDAYVSRAPWVFHAAQICHIKCRCARKYPEKQNQGYFPQISYSKWIGWDFDRDKPIYRAYGRRRKPREKGLTLYGQRKHWTVQQGRFASYEFYGMDNNRPSCRTIGPVEDPFEDMDPQISQFLHLKIPPNVEYHKTEQFCLHYFYGGHNGANMGGTCLKEVGDLRQIVFQQRYKSPQFTLDILSSPTLVDRAGLASIEAYCRRHCSCPHVSYKSKDPDFIPSTKRQRVERGSRQSLRGQFRLPSTDGESSSSMTTDGLEAGSERSPEGTCASLKSVPLGSSGDSSTCAKKAYCSGRSDCSRGQLCKAVQKDVARPLNFNLRKFIGLCAAAPLSIGDTLYG